MIFIGQWAAYASAACSKGFRGGLDWQPHLELFACGLNDGY